MNTFRRMIVIVILVLFLVLLGRTGCQDPRHHGWWSSIEFSDIQAQGAVMWIDN